jgi:hypothetical protein
METTYSLNAMVSNSLLYQWANKRSDFDDLLMDDMAPLSRSDLTSSKAEQTPTKANAAKGTPAQRYKSAKKVKAPKLVLPSAPAVRIDIASTGLNEYDVVCGRSRMAHTHPGNKHFRRLVKEYSFAYQNAKAREEKKRITLSIITTIEGLGGRFLKFEGNDEEDELFGDIFESDTPSSAASFVCTQASAEYQYEKVSHAAAVASHPVNCDDAAAPPPPAPWTVPPLPAVRMLPLCRGPTNDSRTMQRRLPSRTCRPWPCVPWRSRRTFRRCRTTRRPSVPLSTASRSSCSFSTTNSNNSNSKNARQCSMRYRRKNARRTTKQISWVVRSSSRLRMTTRPTCKTLTRACSFDFCKTAQNIWKTWGVLFARVVCAC